jgi:hypothetical protein
MIARALAVAVLVAALAAPAADAKQSHRPGTEVGPPHTVTAYDPSHPCGTDGPLVAFGWCSYYDGALTGRGGEAVELAATVCRLPGQGAHTLQVDSGQHAEFMVGDRGSPAWTWAKGHNFSPYGDSFNVEPGRCLRWHVTWRVVDDTGRPLAPGTYDLIARSTGYPPGSIQARVYLDNMYFVVT